MRTEPDKRSSYKYFHATTRWMDNDVYGHVNNVIYYSWFDIAVNHFLVVNQVLDIEHSPVIGLVIETQCNYFSSVAFPQRVTVGLRVAKLGNSSVRYEVHKVISCMRTLTGKRAGQSPSRKICAKSFNPLKWLHHDSNRRTKNCRCSNHFSPLNSRVPANASSSRRH